MDNDKNSPSLHYLAFNVCEHFRSQITINLTSETF